MKSKHLDGLAVDLVPWGGKPVWEWDRIYPIAFAMDQAATELGLASKIRWGGAWDRVLSDIGGSIDSYREECEAYAKRHPGRPEEHTSELQSLMRISYAVFCLKKQKCKPV